MSLDIFNSSAIQEVMVMKVHSNQMFNSSMRFKEKQIIYTTQQDQVRIKKAKTMNLKTMKTITYLMIPFLL